MNESEKPTCYGNMSYQYDKTKCEKCKLNSECATESLMRDASR